MRIYLKKIKYVLNIFHWFVWYNLWHKENKKVWHLIKVLFKHVFLGTPYSVIIETGNTCNFSCPTCPTPHRLIYQKREPQLMDLEKFEKIIDKVKNYVHIVYLYNSNEPLLHPQIVKMIKYASANNLHTKISTNCSLLNEKMSREILNSGLGEIRLALDSLNKGPFEKFRRGGNFETVKFNIERFCQLKQKLGKYKPITTLQFILNKLNQEEIPAIKNFRRKNKINKLYIKPFVLSEYAYTKKEIEALSAEFFPDKDVYDEDTIIYKKDKNNLEPKRKLKKCKDVQRVFSVLADGRAVMCCFDLLGNYVYGDLDKKDFKEIWFSEKAKKIRRAALKRELPLCKICANIK